MDAATRRLCAGLRARLAPAPETELPAGAVGALHLLPDARGAWLGQLLAAWESGRSVLLADPEAGAERAALAVALAASYARDPGHPPALLLATGGSTGGLRYVVHTAASLLAAAAAYVDSLGPDRCVLNVLPPHHVSGLMPVLRCLVGGGTWISLPWKAWLAGTAAAPEADTVSLVPTQLQRLMAEPDGIARLAGFRRIFIGGAALDPALAGRARAAGLRLAPCYGMTETAAMVCALDPDDFLQGVAGCGRPLAGVELELDAGARVVLQSPSLGEAWWSAEGWRPIPRPLPTGDCGCWTPEGSLRLTGRGDRRIITGGEKVDPEEVERALREALGLSQVCALGVPDPAWGEAVALVWEAPPDGPDLAAVRRALRGRLAGWQLPKLGLRLDAIPRTAAGKVDVVELQRRLRQEPEARGS